MTSVGGFRPTDVFCAKAKRQRHDVGHSGVFTGCEALSLSSSISAGVFCTESVATGTGVWTHAEK
ncbi:hypothetical protein [Lysinibacillus xylanilyticus]|uniref:hypothetical protein n=1 Tax=Lysinibacillus xylanilyticus TaxID=582475 RepID=UPI003D02856B